MTTPFMPHGLAASLGMNEISAAPQGVMSVPEMAGAAEEVVKSVMRVEPMIAGIAGMFVPGLSLVQPWIIMLAPYLERALDDIAKGNNGDVLGAFMELIQHLSSGQPNSSVLSAAPMGSASSTPNWPPLSPQPMSPPSQDPSAQGSG